MPYAINGKVSTDELPGSIHITDEEYAAAIDGFLAGKVVIITGGHMEVVNLSSGTGPDLPIDLDIIRSTFLSRVDADAEGARLGLMTNGSGQAMTYQRKADEAKAFALDANPMPENYPFLANEIGITADTLEDVAQIVSENHEQWVAAGLSIERHRLQTKAAIRAATSVAEIELAYASMWT